MTAETGPAEAHDVGINAYIYLYPLVMMDVTQEQLDQVNSMTAEDFFDHGLGLMKLHPPHPTDWSLLAQMRRLGLVAGARFAGLDPDVRSALRDVPAAVCRPERQSTPYAA